MQNWFPFSDEWLQATSGFTVHERLFGLWIISEANLEAAQGRPTFYRSDAIAAVTLRMGLDKVRRARRRFQAAGLISAVPGFRAKGRNLATTYTAVRMAAPPKAGSWAKVHRHAFHALLAHLRRGPSAHADVWTWLVLLFLRNRYDEDDEGSFFVSKRELRAVTGIVQATECVRRLHDGFHFKNGPALFEYEDQHHRFRFTLWQGFAESSEMAERWRREIAEGVGGLKSKVRKKPRKRGTSGRKAAARLP